MFGQINPPALLLFIRHAPKLPLILHLHAFDPFTPLRLTFDPTYMYILKVQGGFIGLGVRSLSPDGSNSTYMGLELFQSNTDLTDVTLAQY